MVTVSKAMVGLDKGVEVYEGRKVYRGECPGRLRPEKKPLKSTSASGHKSPENK